MKIASNNRFMRYRWALGFALVLLGVSVSQAFAANVTYSVAGYLNLSGSGVTWTVATSSLADTVVVNTTNAVITMSTGTAGTFILFSSSTGSGGISVGTSGAGTSASTCDSSNVTKVVLTATGAVTFTASPTANNCNSNPTPGGGGVIVVPPASSGSPSTPPPVTPAPTSTPVVTTSTPPVVTASSSPNDLKSKLAALQSKLADLLAKTSAPSNASSQAIFLRDLTVGSKSNDVKNLQLLLIKQNKGPAAQALAKNGTTTFFGGLTQRALIEFQKAMGIKPASGYFGPKTRAALNGQ